MTASVAQENDPRRIEDYARMLRRGIPSESTGEYVNGAKFNLDKAMKSGIVR